MSETQQAVVRRSAIGLALLAAAGHLVESWLVLDGRIGWPGGSSDVVGALLVAVLGAVCPMAAVAARRWWPASAIVTAAAVLSIVVDLGAAHVVVRAAPGLAMLVAGAGLAVERAGRSRESASLALRRWLATISLTLYVLLVVLLATLGLVVPMPVVGILGALWVGGLVVAWRMRQHRPGLVPIVLVGLVALAWAVLRVGAAFFGWGP